MIKETQKAKRKTVSIDSFEGFGIDDGESENKNFSRQFDEKNPLNDQGINNPLEILTKRESIKLLQKFIDELKEPERIVIAKAMNGQNYTEIGVDLNVSKQAIRKTYLKAIKKIRESFSHFGIDSSGF